MILQIFSAAVHLPQCFLVLLQHSTNLIVRCTSSLMDASGSTLLNNCVHISNAPVITIDMEI